MMNQTNINNAVIEKPYEEITENDNYINEEDMFIWTKYRDKTKQEILNSRRVSLQEVYQIYERQQQALKDMKILEEDRKTANRISAKFSYVD